MPKYAKRVETLPPYVFSQFQARKKELEQNGFDIIDLGIGAPDLPTPSFIIQKMIQEANKPENHRYSPYQGCSDFKEAVAEFYEVHYNVQLDPATEILALIGSKEGIANFMSAVIDTNDTVLVPNPGYPVYQSAIHLAGGTPAYLPLDSTQNFKPNFQSVSQTDLAQSKLMLLNYPNNPTAGTVELNTLMEAVTIAKEHEIIIAHDAAYQLVTFGDYKAPSIMQVHGAKEHAVEFGSLSKSFNMTGWRIGYVVGNPELIKALATLKSNIDTGQFLPIQKAAAEALRSDLSTVKDNNNLYEKRLNLAMDGLEKLGVRANRPKGTFFLWAEVPKGFTSMEFANLLLEKAGVIVTPGSAFGSLGKDYFRLSLSVSEEQLTEALNRMGGIM
ncbi:aminotransferase class I/II-fold pyridoxal phosphate-dependent enzyme [Aquisalibacillus elongatus]|uniref:Aminotransferase n=1 Tax=Aquisalibacillus elongatus TaxID=485577 RepID=A0A3N5BAI5_9BACI|nr:aminotransferase class I/II-fold pyridoxal phosphate-dependent enzyme [Aquisalibacillus elongatus]RPF54397.1 LL-diaminopimelate aminotransferase [Aquisalibacillus elongatus]